MNDFLFKRNPPDVAIYIMRAHMFRTYVFVLLCDARGSYNR